jgi:hypothetical protein
MARRNYLAWLGGGDPDAVAQSGERTRFTSMGGVLLGTASVAAVSMFFALHHAVGADVGWSIPIALGWGLLILTIDRFMVITMSSTRGHPFQMLGMVLFRLLLAGLIATVVSMPLVLQIFASDIGAELPILAAQKSAQYKQNLQKSPLEGQITNLQGVIKNEQAVVEGTAPGPVQYYEGQLTNLNQAIGKARAAASAADLKYECEIGGYKAATEACPPGTTGIAGKGPHAIADYNAWQQDLATVKSLQGQLSQAESALPAAQRSDGRNVATAQHALSQNETKLAGLEQQYDSDISNDEIANKKDTGLLAQIRGLFSASDQNPGLAIAHWTVTALFFVIELLPVGVKTMLLLGPESMHERIVAMREEAAIKKVQREIDAEREQEEAAIEKIRREIEAEREDAESERQSARDRRAAEEQAGLQITQRHLDAERKIADGKAETLEIAAADIQQRDLANRIEVNESVAKESQNYAMGIVGEWSAAIRDKFRKAPQQPPGDPNGKASDGTRLSANEASQNGHQPQTEEWRIQGYTTPGSDSNII